jgi:hypothetical protein
MSSPVIYPTITLDKKFSRIVATSKLHGQLIRYASRYAAHRVQLTKLAGSASLEALTESLSGDPVVDFFAFVTEMIEDIEIASEADKKDIQSLLKTISEDFDIGALASMSARDPENQQWAYHHVLERVTAKQDADTPKAFAERALRIHLVAAEEITLQAVLGLVARLARCLPPADMPQPQIVAYFVGNARRLIKQASPSKRTKSSHLAA